MSVLMEEMHRIGVKTNILLLLLISSVLVAREIVIHEINKIENITLRNGSSITQGGLVITGQRDKSLIERKSNQENNSSISQGVVIIDDENITDVHYDIINIINGYPLEEE